MVNIGIVGCGWIAQNAHIPTLIDREDAKIISVFDISIDRAKEVASRFDIKNAYDDYESFLKSQVDAVIICTPNSTHAHYSIMALKNGKHVLCEKPVALTTEEINEIIISAQGHEKLFVPGFVNRFRNDVIKLKEILKSKKIGQINKIEAGWIRRSGVPRPGTWFTNEELAGGGVLVDLGSHIIDICLMLIDDKQYEKTTLKTFNKLYSQNEVQATWFKSQEKDDFAINVEDTAIATVQFTNELELDIKLSWLSESQGDITYITVYGTDGIAELKTLFGFSIDRLYVDDTLIVKKINGINEHICFDKNLNNASIAFEGLYNYFINSIKNKELNFLTPQDGYYTVKLIEDLYNTKSD